jgi:hypothetical protein
MRWAPGAVSMFLGLGFGIPCAFRIRDILSIADGAWPPAVWSKHRIGQRSA